MLNCRDVTEKASEYIDGKLPFMQRAGMRVHLLMCRHCRRFVSQLHATIGAVKRLRCQEPDEKTIDDQVTRLLDRKDEL